MLAFGLAPAALRRQFSGRSPARRGRLCSARPSPACAPPLARLTFSDVQQAARHRGLIITNAGAGPFAQLRAHRESGEPVGTLSAALLPGRRVHIESYKALSRTPDGALLRLSPGMLLFIAAIAYGGERGCDLVCGLAIDDDPRQHARLVAYLKRFGGAAVRRVGDSRLRDIPDRLLYGGRGTIVHGSIPEMLDRAAGMVERTRPSAGRAADGS
jgi:hypothetical protein